MKFDTIYKFIAASFAIAYFGGLIVGMMVVSFDIGNYQETDITKSFYLTGQVSFRDVFTENLNRALKMAILPFTFLIIAIKFGFNHATYILSPFLGQIKLAVLFIPQIFYFITYVLFSVIGLKIIATTVLFIANRYLIKGNKQFVNIKIFGTHDVLLLYLALLSLTIGTFTQIYLSRVFFIFLINYQLITYVLILLIYVAIIAFSLYIIYQTIKSILKENKHGY